MLKNRLCLIVYFTSCLLIRCEGQSDIPAGSQGRPPPSVHRGRAVPTGPPPFLLGTRAQTKGTGILQNDLGAFQGYTLYHPLGSKTTYLIDMGGRVVNQWVGRYEGHTVELLENGHLLRLGLLEKEHPIFAIGGAAGSLQEFTWDGQLVWDFRYSGDDYLSHHDLIRLPNGNVLMIAYERKSKAEAIAPGRAAHLVSEQGLWPDHIIEVNPTGKTTGRIVWEWHVWDHLIQGFDPRRENYGVVADHPELINLNPGDWQERLTPQERNKLESLGYIGTSKPKKKDINPDWNHINAIDYHAEFDQIMLCVLGFDELWVIDHSTSRQSAEVKTTSASSSIPMKVS